MTVSEFFTGISLKTWLTLILIASLVGFHFVKIHEAKDSVRTEMQAKIDSQVKDQVIQQLGLYIKTQSALTDSGNKERLAFSKDVALIHSLVSSLKKDYQDHVLQNPVPAGCYYDPYRVRYINQALHPGQTNTPLQP